MLVLEALSEQLTAELSNWMLWFDMFLPTALILKIV